LELKDIETIEFENISGSYPGTDKYALKNVSLTLTKGDTLAIVA
jgi:ABC-type multidrug transport system fused ATPase/permease subunit